MNIRMNCILPIVVVIAVVTGASGSYFEAQTCCLIQNECNNCTNKYHINSIAYCCPGCRGNLMVTALKCSCKITYTDPNHTPACTVSNTIVGDYPYRKPSYYYASGTNVAPCWLALTFSLFLLFLKL